MSFFIVCVFFVIFVATFSIFEFRDELKERRYNLDPKEKEKEEFRLKLRNEYKKIMENKR